VTIAKEEEDDIILLAAAKKEVRKLQVKKNTDRNFIFTRLI
jgi:hypothetical protein